MKFLLRILILTIIIIITGCTTQETLDLEKVEQQDREKALTHFAMWADLGDKEDTNKFISLFGVEYRRKGVLWEWIEPQPGDYTWEGRDAEFHNMEQQGLKFLPVLKTGNFWATKNDNEKEETSSPPKDITEEWDNKYGYSKNYYKFVYNFVNRYKDRLDYIIIENEANAQRFWIGTLDEYSRLLATAHKAAHDASPKIKVADSGFTTESWGYQIAYDNYQEGTWTNEKILSWLKSYFQYSNNIEDIEQWESEDIETYVNDPDTIDRMEEFQLFYQQLPQNVDIVNFHYYEHYKHFPEVVAYLKKILAKNNWKNPPMMINELGNKMQGSRYKELDRNAEEHADSLVKKITIAMAEHLELILWFSANPEGKFDSQSFLGFYDKKGNLVRSATSFQTFMKKIQFYDYAESISTGPIWHYRLYNIKNPKKVLEIIWSETPETLYIPYQKDVTNIYGKTNSLKIEDAFEIDSSPLFIEYTKD